MPAGRSSPAPAVNTRTGELSYLLDGTLLNDMTNGPAGSAAGTSLGTVGQLSEGADYNNLLPRFGGAWDVTGDSRTAVRGGQRELPGRSFRLAACGRIPPGPSPKRRPQMATPGIRL